MFAHTFRSKENGKPKQSIYIIDRQHWKLVVFICLLLFFSFFLNFVRLPQVPNGLVSIPSFRAQTWLRIENHIHQHCERSDAVYNLFHIVSTHDRVRFRSTVEKNNNRKQHTQKVFRTVSLVSFVQRLRPAKSGEEVNFAIETRKMNQAVRQRKRIVRTV